MPGWGGVGIPIRSLDSWRESTKTSGAGDASGIPGVAYPSQRFGSSVTALLNELTHMFSWRFVGATLSTFRINTCKSVSKQTTSTSFRITTYAKTGGKGEGIIVNLARELNHRPATLQRLLALLN